MDLNKLRLAVRDRRIEWKRHVLERMIERDIGRSDVLRVLADGELIETYVDDRPYPSGLILGFTEGGRPMHVVVSLDVASSKVFVITVYEPRADIFGLDYRARKKK